MKKKILLLFFCASTVSAAFAQDVITLKSGDEIQALVQEIGTDEVKYKKFDNKTGPTYTLKKSDIFMIKYANGSKDVFANEPTIEIEKTSSFVFDGMQIMSNDLPQKYSWYYAGRNACPSGWRLPSENELWRMCKHKSFISNFNGKEYWSSEEGRYNKGVSVTTNDCENEDRDKWEEYSVRCVKE
ncbi:hypothetical protein FACS189434_11220 [Bacteroidia bacterium]|nr:hypothetical protein FACS189434_11220 [Bacteroidia bacterium]